MHDIAFDTSPPFLLRIWLSRSNGRIRRNAAWRSFQVRGGNDPSSLAALIGHLISSFLIFVTLLVLTWGVGFLLVWLNRYQPLTGEDMEVISKLKIAMLYVDTILCASVSVSRVWIFIKGVIR